MHEDSSVAVRLTLMVDIHRRLFHKFKNAWSEYHG